MMKNNVPMRRCGIVSLAAALLAWHPPAHAGSVSFETNATFATESVTSLTFRMDRDTATNSAWVNVTLGGDAELGADFEAYAVTHVANPGEGSGKLGEHIAVWGTNLIAVSAMSWGFDGAVVLYDGSGNTLGAILNPDPDLAPQVDNDRFGRSLAFLRGDLIAIGAETDNVVSNDAGGVHLFSWDGTTAAHLTTFTDPQPSFRDYFGCDVAAVSNNVLLVGAFDSDVKTNDAGAVYLYAWNGASATRLTTITNPTAASGDAFGRAVAVLDESTWVVGDEYEDGVTNNVGAVFLFGWAGGTPSLLQTISNPAPASTLQFGHDVAALSSNAILVTADRDAFGATLGGVAYLYAWSNGFATLQATVTNPTPGSTDSFGESVAAVGAQRFVIGASRDDTGATNAGSAYLYEWDGAAVTRLATITNPAPEAEDLFGSSVHGLGSHRFVIGATGDDLDVADEGAAYLYEWDGTNAVLLATLGTRSPGVRHAFGTSMTTLGTNRLVVGAYLAAADEAGSGALHVFDWLGTGLVQVATLLNPEGTYGGFGTTLDSVGSTRLIAGAPQDGSQGSLNGRAFLLDGTGTALSVLATITNPAATSLDYFGSDVAGLGANRFLVGASGSDLSGPDSGIVYLYGWDGASASLLSVVSNPAPALCATFGAAMDSLSAARFVVGAPNSIQGGVAFFYASSGSNVALQAVVTNPTPFSLEGFGSAVEGMSPTRFAVGAPSAVSTNFIDGGEVSVYEWDGSNVVRLATITNPSPGSADQFGASLAALSPSRLVVGAYQATGELANEGLAYLYDWDGSRMVLRETFAYPGPKRTNLLAFSQGMTSFGYIGLVVGAPSDSDVGYGSGSAWLHRWARDGEPLLVEFEPGQTSAHVRVVLLDDDWPEPTNTLSMVLQSTFGVSLGEVTSHTVSIADDDPWARAISPIFRSAPTNAAIVWSDLVPGNTYRLQSSTNLRSPIWTTSTVFTATASVEAVVFPAPTNTAAAYRLVR